MNRAAERINLGRRRLLIGGASVAGGFVLGIPAIGLANMADSEPGGGKIGFFVEILPDNSVIIGSNQPEIGQGARTAIPMMVAEELDVEWAAVSIRPMPLGIVRTEEGFTWKYGGQGVGGSAATRNNWTYMREVGATARAMLIQAAAQRWQVSAEQCSTRPGFVTCEAIGKETSYGELAPVAATLPVPSEPPALKSTADFQIVGKPQKFVHSPDVVTGKARFGIDTEMPGMRYAVIARSPWLNGHVLSFDDSAARQVPGVQDVFRVEGPKPGEPYFILADGVAVVADSSWAAMKGRSALKIEWSKGTNPEESTEGFWKLNRELLEGRGQVVREDGDLDSALFGAATRLTRRYEVPFVSHAPMEPQNCYADVREDSCHIIVPTQSPSGASRSAAAVTGIDRENIHVDMTLVGGGFGRRLTTDYVAEAALISKKAGVPVKLMWTREDDIKHDFYRPSGLHEMTAGLDGEGRVIAWMQRLASASKYYRRPDIPDEDLWTPELYADDFPAHIVPNLRREYFHNASAMPRGSWRAPAHTVNAFVIQSFIDELAHEGGRDPLEFQLKLLGEPRDLPYSNHGGPVFNPGRSARLLRFVAERSGYGKPLPKGRGIGLAVHFTFGGYAAHAIEVTVGDRGELRIEKIVAAIDCGLAVNPAGVEAQLQGATIDGLSTALNLEITVRDGQVVQSNFHDYPLLRIAPVPVDFEAHILPWDEEPAGVGEIGLPPVAPALTNAIFAASGMRIRKLPIASQLKDSFG